MSVNVTDMTYPKSVPDHTFISALEATLLSIFFEEQRWHIRVVVLFDLSLLLGTETLSIARWKLKMGRPFVFSSFSVFGFGDQSDLKLKWKTKMLVSLWRGRDSIVG